MDNGLTRVPVPGGSGRIKTGPMAFEGDWPGYFFRGDEMPLHLLRYAAKVLHEHSEPAIARGMDRLVKEMEASIVGQDWRNG